MDFPAEYKKNNLKNLNEVDIRQMSSIFYLSKQKEDGWDKELEKKIDSIKECHDVIQILLSKNSMNNKNLYDTIQKKYQQLKSNLEKIIVFNIATSVEGKDQETEKPRIKNVFIVTGQIFKDAYDNAKKGVL